MTDDKLIVPLIPEMQENYYIYDRKYLMQTSSASVKTKWKVDVYKRPEKVTCSKGLNKFQDQKVLTHRRVSICSCNEYPGNPTIDTKTGVYWAIRY